MYMPTLSILNCRLNARKIIFEGTFYEHKILNIYYSSNVEYMAVKIKALRNRVD